MRLVNKIILMALSIVFINIKSAQQLESKSSSQAEKFILCKDRNVMQFRVEKQKGGKACGFHSLMNGLLIAQALRGVKNINSVEGLYNLKQNLKPKLNNPDIVELCISGKNALLPLVAFKSSLKPMLVDLFHDIYVISLNCTKKFMPISQKANVVINSRLNKNFKIGLSGCNQEFTSGNYKALKSLFFSASDILVSDILKDQAINIRDNNSLIIRVSKTELIRILHDLVQEKLEDEYQGQDKENYEIFRNKENIKKCLSYMQSEYVINFDIADYSLKLKENNLNIPIKLFMGNRDMINERLSKVNDDSELTKEEKSKKKKNLKAFIDGSKFNEFNFQLKREGILAILNDIRHGIKYYQDIFGAYGIGDVDVMVIGDLGGSLQQQYSFIEQVGAIDENNKVFKKFIDKIKHHDKDIFEPLIGVFIINNQRGHWYTCVVEALKDKLHYYIADSMNAERCNFWQINQLRELIGNNFMKDNI